MKLFTLCAFALTLAFVGVVMVSATDSDSEENSEIERGSDVEYDYENTNKHHRKHHKHKKHHKKHHPRHPTRHPKQQKTSPPPFNPDYDFTTKPDTITSSFGNYTSNDIPFSDDTTTSNPFSDDTTTSNPFSDDTTTSNPFSDDTRTSNPFSNDTTTRNPFNNETTRYQPTYPTNTSGDPNQAESCELYSIKEKSFLARLNYFKNDLVENYERTSKHNAQFYKTIYVRKCTYDNNSDFGFHIHYLLQVSACLKGEEPTAQRNCTYLPSTVVRCEADLISDKAICRGCALDNLEKSNSDA